MAGSAERTHFGFQDVNVEDKARLVGEVFNKVAGRYDLMNDLMSGGLHRAWKDAMVAWLNPPKKPANRPWAVVDVAGGHRRHRLSHRRCQRARGHRCHRHQPGNAVRGRAPLARARRRPRVRFTAGDAMALPLADATRDAYTIAFGIRNVTDVPAALSEAYRVLRPGGRFMCLEFSAVDVPGLDRLYDLYSFKVIPPMGRMVIGEAEPYQYLVESIRRFPDQDTFADMIAAAGFRRVQYRNLTGGVAALHSGWKI